jgi:hypothetical protein
MKITYLGLQLTIISFIFHPFPADLLKELGEIIAKNSSILTLENAALSKTKKRKTSSTLQGSSMEVNWEVIDARHSMILEYGSKSSRFLRLPALPVCFKYAAKVMIQIQ